MDAARKRFLVIETGEDILPLLSDRDRGARVLTRGQHHVGGDVRVLQQLEGHDAIVGRRVRVRENLRELREVTGSEQMRNIANRLGGEQGERLGFNLQQAATVDFDGRNVLVAELAIRGAVLPQFEHLLKLKVAHDAFPSPLIHFFVLAIRRVAKNGGVPCVCCGTDAPACEWIVKRARRPRRGSFRGEQPACARTAHS